MELELILPLNNVVRDKPYAPNRAVESRQERVLRTIPALVSLTDVLPEHQRGILAIALWKWTEASGLAPNPKYNIRYPSEGALKQGGIPKSVNHEHVWTRQWMTDELFPRGPWNPADPRGFLEAHGVSRIITVSEHSKLEAAEGQRWGRTRKRR